MASDEDEIRKLMAQFKAAELPDLSSALSVELPDLSSALSFMPNLPDLSGAMSCTVDFSEALAPSKAAREAWRRLYGYEPATWLEMIGPRFRTAGGQPAASLEPKAPPATAPIMLEPPKAPTREPAPELDNHANRVAVVRKLFGTKERPFWTFYSRLGVSNSEFCAWGREDHRHCGQRKWQLLDEAAVEVSSQV